MFNDPTPEAGEVRVYNMAMVNSVGYVASHLERDIHYDAEPVQSSYKFEYRLLGLVSVLELLNWPFVVWFVRAFVCARCS